MKPERMGNVAKKKVEKAQKPWAEQVEEACREAVSSIPGFQNATSEQEWCEAVSEGLGLYKFGIDARLQELSSDDGEE
jgi:histidinol dehydrogenase